MYNRDIFYTCAIALVSEHHLHQDPSMLHTDLESTGQNLFWELSVFGSSDKEADLQTGSMLSFSF